MTTMLPLILRKSTASFLAAAALACSGCATTQIQEPVLPFAEGCALYNPNDHRSVIIPDCLENRKTEAQLSAATHLTKVNITETAKVIREICRASSDKPETTALCVAGFISQAGQDAEELQAALKLLQVKKGSSPGMLPVDRFAP